MGYKIEEYENGDFQAYVFIPTGKSESGARICERIAPRRYSYELALKDIEKDKRLIELRREHQAVKNTTEIE